MKYVTAGECRERFLFLSNKIPFFFFNLIASGLHFEKSQKFYFLYVNT